jgi:hypothetical protein
LFATVLLLAATTIHADQSAGSDKQLTVAQELSTLEADFAEMQLNPID